MSTLTYIAIAIMGLLIVSSLEAESLSIDASATQHAGSAEFHMGTSRSPDGHEITVTSTCLMRDGKPWLPVMGEFHYSRYPANEWREELLKMKAGGIDIVASYVFWIHHEEVEGAWDWSGQRNLREFAIACRDVGLPLIVRIGPWDHGEVRHGGFPDWLIAKKLRTRSDDPEYMAYVTRLYQQVGEQLKGQLWKDGGPVVGVQVENEFGGAGTHLLNLKKLARDAGLDVPLYTRTGWPNLRSPVPFGELLPLFGAYAEGFWDRTLDPMPSRYWRAFTFAPQRTDNAIATDQLGARQSRDELDAQQYPYLTCELGGGMMSSYHRRIRIEPMDVLSVLMCKVGSGSNLPGYYMYHGGANPESKTGITLQEAQNTAFTNYNDMPVKNYDFQAPLGEFGQVRDSFSLLRRMHSFLRGWGEQLAPMPAVYPENRPKDKSDSQTLRWAVRTDGTSGFLFVNNYQRGLEMPPQKDVQFEIKLRDGMVHIPSTPISIPANSSFVWPFNLDLGGAKLIYATAQPVCRTEVDGTLWVIFAQTPGVSACFGFDDDGRLSRFDDVKPGLKMAFGVPLKSGKVLRVILLDDETSRHCFKGMIGGRERIVVARGSATVDAGKLRLSGATREEMSAAILPADGGVEEGVFKRFSSVISPGAPSSASIEAIQPAGPPREIKKGARGVAEAPADDDFAKAAVWRIKLPANADPNRRLTLRINYAGDVARVYLDGKLIADDFYNGNPMEIGLRRFGPDVWQKELLLKILPLRKDAPIYLPKDKWPDFSAGESLAAVKSIEIVEEYQAEIAIK